MREFHWDTHQGCFVRVYPEERGKLGAERIVTMGEWMMTWFEYKHLPLGLQEVSKWFRDVADLIVEKIEPGPERTVALRKLLEAKDAAVRAKLHPGG
jgi:nitrogenase molybdenum-iron protein alpha/beta subunit